VCILKYPPTWQNVAAPFAREGREAKREAFVVKTVEIF
jgi:hypothetical protein